MERFPHGCYDVTHEHRLCKYSTGGRGEARVYFLAHRRVYSLPAATHVLPAVPAFSPRPRSNVVVYDYVICLRGVSCTARRSTVYDLCDLSTSTVTCRHRPLASYIFLTDKCPVSCTAYFADALKNVARYSYVLARFV